METRAEDIEISVVTTMYRSAAYVAEFHRRMTAAVQRITQNYEIIFINDGSPDNSLDVAIAAHRQDPKVRVVDLSRNFGHHKALMTGMAQARGKLVFLIDVDLEEAPEFIGDFHAELMKDDELSVVYGVQDARKGKFTERLGGLVFYTLFNFMSPVKVPENLLTARLMKRDYVNALLEYRDRELFLGGLFALAGFRQKPLVVHKLSNATTTYTVGKRIMLFINGITSFTGFPLLFISLLGICITGLAGIALLYLVIHTLFHGFSVTGWASLMVSIWFMGGILLFAVGVMGIYVSRIYAEVKDRPYTTIRKKWGGE